MLSVIINPNRYRSKAAEAFSREILPHFATQTWKAEVVESTSLKVEAINAAAPNSASS
jgi:hypothetical protein